jgi:hypothetical protein
LSIHDDSGSGGSNPVRQWLGPAVLYAAATLAFARPLLAHLTSVVPHDAGDPVLNTWILWWSTERLPLTGAWWNAPMFYPTASVMAFSEVLIGLLPITAPVQWVSGNPLLAYNVAFLLSFPLCGLAAYALAFELTARRDASLIAGLAFAFAPYRMGQLSHLQMLSYYWAPCVLLGLHRYLRTREKRWLVVFAASWLFQALSNGYAMFHVSVLVLMWIAWFARSRRDVAAILLAWVCALPILLPVLLKYGSVHAAFHFERDINEIKRFGLDLGDFLSASPESVLWGDLLWTARLETAAFPGAAMVAILAAGCLAAWHAPRAVPLATMDRGILIATSMVAASVALSVLTIGPWRIGPLTVTDFHKPFSIAVAARLLAFIRGPWLRAAWNRRSTAVFYGVAMVLMYILALGPEPRVLGRPFLYEPPYSWLMHLPGFAALRVPARFAMVAVLCQSALLAFLLARWSLGSRRTLVCAAVGAALVADGWARLPVVPAPEQGPAHPDAVSAVLELPPGTPEVDFPAIYHSMRSGVPTVNGFSGYAPPHYLPLGSAIRAGEFAALREIAPGRTLAVVVNRSRADAPPVEEWLARQPDVQLGPSREPWATYLITPPITPVRPSGPEVPISEITMNQWTEDSGRARDGRLDTAWHGGSNQIGNEEVIVDLGTRRSVGRVVFEMGAFALGFPRELTVEAETAGNVFTTVWQGATAGLTVRAAIADPEVVPLTIDLSDIETRRLRLRQTGHEPGIPWWIPEVRVFSRASGAP